VSNQKKAKNHPGADEISVVYPSKATMQAVTDRVTRDEFQRRMAGLPSILDQLHQGGRRIRVITLIDPEVIARWWDTAEEV
jgi:hypothetical protein